MRRMSIRRFPSEFESLLTAKGRRVLAGRVPDLAGALADPQRRFVALRGLVDQKRAADCRDLLDRVMRPVLSTIETPIPPEILLTQERNAEEWLPKTARQKTAYLQRRTAKAYREAQRIGLVEMLRSESFHAFAEALAGRALKRRWGMQLLCYEEGDYVGPHNDHFPEEPAAAGGYVDVHLTLANDAVAHQWLVYAEKGHFRHVEAVHANGGITAYRLPFWHYTTPLVAKPKRESEARRWVLLGTFLYAKPGPLPPKR